MRNLAFLIAYDGTDFRGWQTQPNGRTVQETMETAIREFTGAAKVHLNASGRTDSGVHAVGQVANLHTEAPYPVDVFVNAINARLPDDVVIYKGWEVAQDFDATRHAKRKLYRYVMHDGNVPDPFLRRYCYHHKRKFDDAAMNRAARCLLGRHDFRSFESEWPNRTSSIRTITYINLNRVGDYLWLDVEANGFLYNMVRAIAGTLMDVGRGHIGEDDVKKILVAQDRNVAGPVAAAQGLFLMRVTYE
jgi:tRNA pseudouridine38-40 synthase